MAAASRVQWRRAGHLSRLELMHAVGGFGTRREGRGKRWKQFKTLRMSSVALELGVQTVEKKLWMASALVEAGCDSDAANGISHADPDDESDAP